MAYVASAFGWFTSLYIGFLVLKLSLWVLRCLLRSLWLTLRGRLEGLCFGPDRRIAWPIDVPKGLDAAEVLAAGDVDVQRKLMARRNGEQLFYQVVSPPPGQHPSRMMLFVHGFAANSDAYLHILADLAKAGTAVVAVDQLGHGCSDGPRFHVADWWDYADAVSELVDSVVEPLRRSMGAASTPLPLFAAGHSIGGAVSLGLAIRRPNCFTGLICLAPYVAWPTDEWDVPVLLSDPLWRCLRPFQLPLLLYQRGGSPHRASFVIALHYQYTTWRQEHVGELRVPLLIFQGLDDPITLPQFAMCLERDAGSKDKELKLLEGVGHDIGRFVVQDWTDWMAARSPA